MKSLLLKGDFNFWRKLINAWSFLFFSLIIADFIKVNHYNGILNVVSTIYISILAIYVSNKEFERWYDKHEGNHPGEIFVIIWSAIVMTLVLFDFALGTKYNIPNAVTSSYIAVLTILVITKKSKELYQIKYNKKPAYNKRVRATDV